MRKEFTKADLKDGMVVEYRNGERRIVLGGVLYSETKDSKLCFYDENLLDNCMDENFTGFDIMKVYDVKYHKSFKTLFDDDNLRLVWEREEVKVKRMTIEEMRQKLEELTGEKIEIEQSRDA